MGIAIKKNRFNTKINETHTKLDKLYERTKISSAHHLGYIKKNLIRVIKESRRTADAIKKIKLYEPKLEKELEKVNAQIKRLNKQVTKQMMNIDLKNPEKTKEYIELHEYLRRRDELSTLLKVTNRKQTELKKQLISKLITKKELFNKIKNMLKTNKRKKE